MSIVQNGKLGIGKPLSLIKVPRRTLQGFQPEFSVLGIVPNGKLGVKNLGKLILRGFPSFRELRVFHLALTHCPSQRLL